MSVSLYVRRAAQRRLAPSRVRTRDVVRAFLNGVSVRECTWRFEMTERDVQDRLRRWLRKVR